MELVASFVRDLEEIEQENEGLEISDEEDQEVRRASKGRAGGRKGSKKRSKDNKANKKSSDPSTSKGQVNAVAKRAKENMDLRQNRVGYLQGASFSS